MSLSFVLDVGLAALVFATAFWIIVAREALAAVIGFVAYGLLLALVWVRLAAVDVALTEAAIGSGATGLLLIAAVGRLRQTDGPTAAEQTAPAMRYATAGLCTLVALAIAAVVVLLPDPAPTLAPAAMANLPATGLGNPVTGVLVAYRALDTLLETVVLVPALIGVWSFAPNRFWGGRPGLLRRAESDSVLGFLAQLLPPLGIMVGIHLVWVGANEPGGAFQGGTILAAMWIIAKRAGLADAPPIDRLWLRLVLIAGPAIFIAIGLAGMVSAGAFLAFPPNFAKPLILLIEAGLTLSIAASLALLVIGPPQRMPQS
jgi:multisubunit Na+/H+ antiporter MnhB subunit